MDRSRAISFIILEALSPMLLSEQIDLELIARKLRNCLRVTVFRTVNRTLHKEYKDTLMRFCLITIAHICDKVKYYPIKTM